MKRFKFLSMLLLMLVTTFSFAACSDDDDDDVARTSIVGNWFTDKITMSGWSGETLITFQSDGKGRVYTRLENSTEHTYYFEYTYTESAIDGTAYINVNGSNVVFGNRSFDGKHVVEVFPSELNIDDGWLTLERR